MISFGQILENYDLELKLLSNWAVRTGDYKTACAKYNGLKTLMHDLKRECSLELLHNLRQPNSSLIRRNPTDNELEKFNDNNFPLVGILLYRGLTGYIYLDDYGQQEFIKCDGKEWSAGAYNCNPELDFSDFMDDIADFKVLDLEESK